MLLQRRNFREHRLAAVQLRRIPLPETVWKPRIGSITRSHEPAKRANEHLFGAWRHRKARDRTRPATFRTVSPRTSVDKGKKRIGASVTPRPSRVPLGYGHFFRPPGEESL